MYTVLNHPMEGFPHEYRITFKFEPGKADGPIPKPAEVDVYSPNSRTLHVSSNTDGYHWLAFWMAQEAGTKILWDSTDHGLLVRRIQDSLGPLGLLYEYEDKETCFVRVPRGIIRRETIDVLAQFLEARLALRHRFFKDDE